MIAPAPAPCPQELDLDAIEARARAPWRDGCGEMRYKCACIEQPSDGKRILSLVTEVRRMHAVVVGRDALLDEREAALAAEIGKAERAREEAALWRALAQAHEARGSHDGAYYNERAARVGQAKAALRAAGIDPDALEGP